MSNTSRNVLYAEDNPDHAALVVRSLKKIASHCKVHVVEDGQAALDYVFRHGEYEEPEKSPRPDLILLDLRLPKVDGLEVLRTVKSSTELTSIPVVILSSSDAQRDQTQAYHDQANSYLVKPLDFDTFFTMVETLSSYWLVANHEPCDDGADEQDA